MNIVNPMFFFLFFLFITGVLYYLHGTFNDVAGDSFQILIDFLLVPSAVITATIFFSVLFRFDPLPLLRQVAYQTGLQQLVNFADAIPDELEDELAVANVQRVDTDSDGFSEWVVFYQFDLQDGRNPVQAVVYDNDRGDPPVLFPYALRPPNRDYLGERGASIEMRSLLDNPDDQDEIFIWGQGNTSLTIFKFVENSESWDFPRDAPARYQPLGFFRGNGGIGYDGGTKNVTVIDRNGFERSQLAIRSIYALNSANDTYLDSFDSTKLSAPIVSTIDFFDNPPTDIYNTSFPEKIVLGFYASLCGGSNDTLCGSANSSWQPAQFLASDALTEFQNGNAGYFGLNSLGVSEISIADLRYHPQLETDLDLEVTGGGRDLVTGEQAQFNVVDITFVVGGTLETVRYEMRLIEGEWKIVRRLEADVPALGAQEFTPTN